MTTQRVPNVHGVWNTLGSRCTNVPGSLGQFDYIVGEQAIIRSRCNRLFNSSLNTQRERLKGYTFREASLKFSFSPPILLKVGVGGWGGGGQEQFPTAIFSLNAIGLKESNESSRSKVFPLIDDPPC